MAEIRVERIIAAPLEHVFDWVADPAHLTEARLILWAGWAKGTQAAGLGAVRNAIAAGMWLREEYTAYDAPRSYSYLIVHSVPALNHDGGTLTLTPSVDGTHIDWVTAFTHPVWVGGKALEAVTARAIRSGFVEILDSCAKALETP
ncbi:SRPBCC family protein [Mycobacterium sp. ITM-2016-00318]|uniref:SRPBCC family protein n=1 Tax=Mycobacterium sp. ITM-2016-00318 TaxID=2099693 RepID=UPI000CF8B9E2|nr:SRPBCC family protein [Mycobacterium sp. ITM-2016-00318]WNG94101.1 SRPBCC family protein [Mycobacterium sp. ITM-2016-00318]